MKYNHMFDVAFTVEVEEKDPEKIGSETLLAGLLRRAAYLAENEDECVEAFGYSDSHEVTEPSVSDAVHSILIAYQEEFENDEPICASDFLAQFSEWREKNKGLLNRIKGGE